MAWVGDLAFAAYGDATVLIRKVSHLMSLIVDVEHAMKLSYGQGKTAAMMEFRGRKAVRERQRLEKQMGSKIQLMTEH